jgi:GNAT superfamily N-acetyltransferase
MAAEPSAAGLARRVEEACLNGWPALREVWYDGWLLRFSEGHTRRSNSVTPIASGTRGLRDKIAYCEALYAAAGLPPLFRVPSIAEPSLDAALDALDYAAAEDKTCVMLRDFTRYPPETTDAELSEGAPSEAWLAAHVCCAGSTAGAAAAQRKILGALAVPAVFAAARGSDGSLASVAFGAVHDRMICVNLVATAPPARRQGLSRRTVAAVLAWGERIGADAACLPVIASNAPAVALYRSLGFDRELYRYHYRRRPAATVVRAADGDAAP